MNNADLMTPDELRELANKKERESQIVRRGVLKHDLYHPPTVYGFAGICYYNSKMGHWLLTEQQKNAAVEEFAESFKKVLPKGTPFIAFKVDGELCWYDDINYGCEDEPNEWAEEHLENIEVVNEK